MNRFFSRPPVAGIAGSEKKGCQSIVLAGGYEDDEDNGDEFTYTVSIQYKRVSGPVKQLGIDIYMMLLC